MKSKLLCIFITIVYTISCISYANVDNTEEQSPSITTSDITIDETDTEINSGAVENQQQDNDDHGNVELDDSIVQIDKYTFKTSDGLVIFETKPDMSKDEWISYMTDYLNDFQDGTFRLEMKYGDMKIDRTLAQRSVGSLENSLNDKQISAVLDVCSTTYSTIVENSSRVDDIIKVAQMYADNKKIPEDEKNYLRLNGEYKNKKIGALAAHS